MLTGHSGWLTLVQRGDLRAHAFSHSHAFTECGSDQHDKELVAAVTARQIDVTDGAFDHVGGAPQCLVTMDVSAGVVVGLELVEVDKQHGHGAILPARALQSPRPSVPAGSDGCRVP